MKDWYLDRVDDYYTRDGTVSYEKVLMNVSTEFRKITNGGSFLSWISWLDREEDRRETMQEVLELCLKEYFKSINVLIDDINHLTFEEEYDIKEYSLEGEPMEYDTMEDLFLREDELPEWVTPEGSVSLRNIIKSSKT